MGIFKKKRSKKALSQVDWAISLSIFLLYLVWFFLFVRPIGSPDRDVNTLQGVIEDSLLDEIQQKVFRLPVYINQSVSSEYEPVIISDIDSATNLNLSCSGGNYAKDENKLFFLANISNTSQFYFYYPHNSLQKTKNLVISDEGSARVGDFSIFFENYLPDQIYYAKERRLFDFNVKDDDQQLSSAGDFRNISMASRYRNRGSLNHTTYIFAENARLYSYITPTDGLAHNVSVSFVLDNYTNFYYSQSEKGEITYSIRPNCFYLTNNFFDYYSIDSGISIMFDNDVEMFICINESNIALETNIQTDSEYKYYIFLHDADYNSVKEYPIVPVVGILEEFTAISEPSVYQLESYSYNYLKELFGFPQNRDFNITVSGKDFQTNLGTNLPARQNVYAKRTNSYYFDRFFNQQPINISLSIW